MRFHGLDLNLLVALDALLTHQNVTRAAEQLNLSQSALSGALARLREHFDDELVVPIGRRMEPTPLARTLAEPLHEILLKTKSLVTATPTFDPQTSNRRISITRPARGALRAHVADTDIGSAGSLSDAHGSSGVALSRGRRSVSGMGKEVHYQPSSFGPWVIGAICARPGDRIGSWLRALHFCEPLGYPIGYIAARGLHIISADVLNSAFALSKDL